MNATRPVSFATTSSISGPRHAAVLRAGLGLAGHSDQRRDAISLPVTVWVPDPNGCEAMGENHYRLHGCNFNCVRIEMFGNFLY